MLTGDRISGSWHPFASVLAIAALLAPGRADACGALPSPTFTISRVSPSDGSSEIARDTGIIVGAIPSSSPGGPTEFAAVDLIDVSSGEASPLTSVSWFSLGGPEETMAVHPVEPLAPQHDYRIEATLRGGSAAALVSSFSTSDALLEPLVLTGTISLSLRSGQVDVVECGPCGGECKVAGKQPALLADVQLPVPKGGQGVYLGALHFTDDEPAHISARDPSSTDGQPHEVMVTQFVKLEADEAQTLHQEIFVEDASYAGCFTFAVWDPAGNVAHASGCLPSMSPDEIRARARGGSTLFGCSVSARAPTTMPAWLAPLLLTFFAWRRGRSR